MKAQANELNRTINEEDNTTLLYIQTLQSQPSQETHAVLKRLFWCF